MATLDVLHCPKGDAQLGSDLSIGHALLSEFKDDFPAQFAKAGGPFRMVRQHLANRESARTWVRHGFQFRQGVKHPLCLLSYVIGHARTPFTGEPLPISVCCGIRSSEGSPRYQRKMAPARRSNAVWVGARPTSCR